MFCRIVRFFSLFISNSPFDFFSILSLIFLSFPFFIFTISYTGGDTRIGRSAYSGKVGKQKWMSRVYVFSFPSTSSFHSLLLLLTSYSYIIISSIFLVCHFILYIYKNFTNTPSVHHLRSYF